MYASPILTWPLAVRENIGKLCRCLEDELVAWWMHQAEQRSDLVTLDGERLVVLDAGVMNDGPGPDILNVRVFLDDRELSGAVEMHLNSTDWYQHKHHQDSAYEEVILHVVTRVGTIPDIPTLKIPVHQIGRGRCLASIPVDQSMLIQESLIRFLNKQDHMQHLERMQTSYRPLLLGMIEIVLSGSQRQKHLYELAMQMGLDKWPDNKTWLGSRQSYPRQTSKSKIIKRLLDNAQVFDRDIWNDLRGGDWSDYDLLMKPLVQLGLSQNQTREWLINKLAPAQVNQTGFEMWLKLPAFIQYGVEKRTRSWIGLEVVETVAQQQGILAWYEKYCHTPNCTVCPLIQSSQALTRIN